MLAEARRSAATATTAPRQEESPMPATPAPDAPTRQVQQMRAAAADCAEERARLGDRRRAASAAVAASRRRRAGKATDVPAEPRPATSPPRPFEAQLIRDHIGLARHLASRYHRKGEAAEDLEQVALLALVRAARRYDPERGIPFPGYAAPSILGELKRHFRDRTWSMRVPRRLKELYLQAREVRDEVVHRTGVSPTVPELAERLGCDPDTLLEAMEAGHNFHAASIDGLDEAAGRQLPCADGGFDGALDRYRLHQLLPLLTADERRILQMRFTEERTQSSIAAELGVSQMHVSRSLERIFAKLRSGMDLR